MSHPKAPRFTPSYSWISNDAQAFRPREGESWLLQMIVETLLKNDKQFEQVLRQCKDGWYLAITLGHDNLHMRLYDIAEVENPKTPRVSTSLNMQRTVFLSVNRAAEFRTLEPALVATRLLHTAPMQYVSRNLKPIEVAMCNNMQRALSPQPASTALVAAAPALPSLDRWRDDVFLEPSPQAIENHH